MNVVGERVIGVVGYGGNAVLWVACAVYLLIRDNMKGRVGVSPERVRPVGVATGDGSFEGGGVRRGEAEGAEEGVGGGGGEGGGEAPEPEENIASGPASGIAEGSVREGEAEEAEKGGGGGEGGGEAPEPEGETSGGSGGIEVQGSVSGGEGERSEEGRSEVEATELEETAGEFSDIEEEGSVRGGEGDGSEEGRQGRRWRWEVMVLPLIVLSVLLGLHLLFPCARSSNPAAAAPAAPIVTMPTWFQSQPSCDGRHRYRG